MPKEETKEEAKPAKKKFKYLCDGCTNEAFHSDKVEDGKPYHCPFCQRDLIAKEDNFVAI